MQMQRSTAVGTIPLPRPLHGLAATLVGAHGLIHLLGFAAYWPLADVASLPYHTTLFGAWDVGPQGMAVDAALWLLAAAGFLGAVVAAVARQRWWRTALAVVTLLSLALTVADWGNARAGAIVDAMILVVLWLSQRASA